MKIKQLREALKKISTSEDDMEIQVWLPGSYIRLNAEIFEGKGKLLIEGNLEPGSALSR